MNTGIKNGLPRTAVVRFCVRGEVAEWECFFVRCGGWLNFQALRLVYRIRVSKGY